MQNILVLFFLINSYSCRNLEHAFNSKELDQASSQIEKAQSLEEISGILSALKSDLENGLKSEEIEEIAKLNDCILNILSLQKRYALSSGNDNDINKDPDILENTKNHFRDIIKNRNRKFVSEEDATCMELAQESKENNAFFYTIRNNG